MTNPSPQQLEFLHALTTTEANLAVHSGAGTGKSTTLEMGCHALIAETSLLSRPVSSWIVALAFNKKIALALQKRLPPGCDASTLNSFGHRAWARKIQPKIAFNEKKVWELTGNLNIEYGTLPDWSRLMSLSRANTILPRKYPGQPLGIPLTHDWLDETINNYGLDVGEYSLDQVYELLSDGLALDIELGWRGNIDYDDQLYLPALYGPGKSTYRVGLIDEAQDLTVTQAQLVERIGCDRVAFFGDPNQAIYAFRGAMPSAFDELVERFSATILRLNVSFRCPKAVVREAQRYVPDYFAADSNPDGLVSRAPFDPRALPKPLTILCRNNAPLTRAAYAFLKEGIGVNFVGGQDLAKQLTTLLRKLVSLGASSLQNALDTWEVNEAGKLMAKQKSADSIHDRADTMRAIIERVGTDPTSLNVEIGRMFTRTGVVTLSTIHKAKGLEWPDVALLEFGLIGARARDELARIQERNLAYVAITRAQRTLTYLE